MSKYYSYIFYADRNVRPCTILGYSHNIPQKSRDIKCITRVIETSGTIAKEITNKNKTTPPNCEQKKDLAMNNTHSGSSQRHQLSISVLNNINIFDGKQGHKLDDWLADIENAAAIVEEDEVVVAKGKVRGLARDLIREHESQPWHHIKEQLCNHLNNASIHTYTSRFMEIQQKDSEKLTAYIHRFKKEAKHCNFDLHPAKIRIFLKGLINSSRIAPSVYKKGPTTIEDSI